jgi:hypothetical protein
MSAPKFIEKNHEEEVARDCENYTPHAHLGIQLPKI